MIIIGLGNPGKDYLDTRHNVGFEAIEALAKALGADWTADRDVAVARYGDHWLIKPQTYMNRSGDALKDFFTYKNIATDPATVLDQMIVIHDELDFPPGEVKAQRDRSSAGHNGVQSIIDAFSTKDFTRFRIGIGKSPHIPTDEYVLQNIPDQERPAINEAIATTAELLRKKIVE